MSYCLLDVEDNYLGDVASNAGLAELRESDQCPESLRNFIEVGEGGQSDCEQIAQDVKDIPELRHWGEAIGKAKTFPVRLSDGT